MAVPKRRMSRSNTRSRRAQWKATEPGLVTVSVGGRQPKVPRRLLKAARMGLTDLDNRWFSAEVTANALAARGASLRRNSAA